MLSQITQLYLDNIVYANGIPLTLSLLLLIGMICSLAFMNTLSIKDNAHW